MFVVDNTAAQTAVSGVSGIGVFGGTFDPVHMAHLRMALEMREQLQLERVHLVPSHRPPHRTPPLASPAQRLEMLTLAARDCEGLVIDDRELTRQAPSYMVDTLQSLRDELGRDRPVVLGIGADAFAGLPGWHRWRELFDFASIVVFDRPGAAAVTDAELQACVRQRRVDDLRMLTAVPHGRLAFLRVTALDISATSVRHLIASHRSPQFLVCDAVWDYIRQHHLYCSDHQCSGHRRE